ncbi:MAG: ATP-binding cassette domain-containing protein, partial [Bacteroidaceae bacterium]
IEAGSFVCITGESGCGKSTLLRLMNGLLIPQKGKISVCDKILSPDNLLATRRMMGYILQDGSLFPHLTVYQNMTFCMNLQQVSAEKCKARIDELLPLLNLSPDLLPKFPNELSGGQRQRVGIIRGIAHKPKIVLMDEPFSSLDPETRESLQDLVKNIHQKTSTTFVMITHSLSEAEKLGSMIVRM